MYLHDFYNIMFKIRNNLYSLWVIPTPPPQRKNSGCAPVLIYKISWKSVQWKPSWYIRKEGRTDLRTDRQTGMTKPIVAFHNFADPPKNDRRYECVSSVHPPNNTVFVRHYRRRACHWLRLQPLSYSWSSQSSWSLSHCSRRMLGLWWDQPCSSLSHCAATVLVRRHTGGVQPCILIPSAQSQMDMTMLWWYV
jgi:hypothetical protein